jgi:hypothetical protein
MHCICPQTKVAVENFILSILLYTMAASAPLNVEFNSLDAAYQAVRNFVIEQGESFIVSPSDPVHYIVTC